MMTGIIGRKGILRFVALLYAISVLPLAVWRAGAQTLPAPSMSGPLQVPSTLAFNAGPLGKVNIGGVVSGIGFLQGNWIPGDQASHWDLSNGQVFIEKNTGWWQFYLQAGAYNLPALGVPFLSTVNTVNDFYGAFPQGYLKLAPKGNFSILIGALPTLIGAEYTFDFENMNIERGLLWNQENAVNRGVQINDSIGHLSGSISWNDGFYSNRYSWLSGALTYTRGPHSLEFVGMGNLGHTKYQTLATPVQNNSVMYALEYTYTKGSWIVQPYYQYSDVPGDLAIGIVKATSTEAGALLVSHTFAHGFSLAGRGEYISSSGNATDGAQNLLYGPGSSAWSATVTPTFQKQRFFIRGDASAVHAVSLTAGDAFGKTGSDANQIRGVLETGFLF